MITRVGNKWVVLGVIFVVVASMLVAVFVGQSWF